MADETFKMHTNKTKPVGTLRTLERLGSFLKIDLIPLIKNFSWLTGSQSITVLSSFLLSIAFANLLPPEIYGTYRYLISLSSIIAISSLSGMNISLTASIARGKEGDWKRVVRFKLLIGLLGSLGGLLVASYYIWQQNLLLGYSLIIISVLAPIVDTILIYSSILQGKKDFKRLSQYAGFSQILFAASMFVALLSGDNLYIIIFVYFASLFLGRYAAFRVTKINYKLNQEKDPDTIRRGFHLSLNSVITTISANIDKLIIFTYLGTVELAVYSIATAPVDQIRGIFKNLNVLILPKYAAQETVLIKKSIYRKVLILLLGCGGVMLIYILLAPFIFPILFPKYTASIPFSIINAFSILAVPALIPSTLLQAKASNQTYYRYNTFSSLIQIILLFIGAYYFQLIGVVVAKTIGQLGLFAVSLYYSRKLS